MDGTKVTYRLSKAEFDRLKPIQGHIIVKSSMDMSEVTYETLRLYVDTSFEPENHQEVFNIVIKVPDRAIYQTVDYLSEIQIFPGDNVIINYYPILTSSVIDVDGEIYRIVPYQWVLCTFSDKDDVSTYFMHNDFLLVERVPEKLHDIELEVHQRNSKHYFKTIVKASRHFEHLKRSNDLLEPEHGDYITMRDANVYALEHEMHMTIGKPRYYIAKLWKVMSIVEPE